MKVTRMTGVDPCSDAAAWCVGAFIGAIIVGAVLGRIVWWGVHESIALAAKVMM